MVMERLGAARELPENQGQGQQLAIDIAVTVLRKGKVKDPGPKEPSVKRSSEIKEVVAPPELNLEAEWQKQSQNFLRLGFHVETGYSDTDEGRQEYLDSLPKFETQPVEYKGRLDKPLLVEKRIPWVKQAELAGIDISDYLRSRLGKTRPWEGKPSNAPQDKPYAAYFNNWGQRFPDPIAPFDARNQLAEDEFAGDAFEGIAKEIHFPQDGVNGRHFDLIGTSVESGVVVYLGRWSGGPRLYAYIGGHADPRWRPLVRGSKVVTR